MKHILLVLASILVSLGAYGGISRTVTFDRSDLSFSEVKVDDQQMIMVNYHDLISSGLKDEPILPRLSLTFSVPYNANDFTLSYNCGVGERINLSAPVQVATDEVLSTQPQQQSENTESESEIAEISMISSASGIYKLVTVSITPFSTKANEQTGQFYNSVTFNLDWTINNSDATAEVFSSKSLARVTDKVKNAVENPEDLEKNMRPTISPLSVDVENFDYIIITPARFCNAMERLAALRRLKGYDAKVFALESILKDPKYLEMADIKDDAGRLRAFIKERHKYYGAMAVLLAGKYPEMPVRIGRTLSTSDKINKHLPTDLYFAEVDNSWYDNDSTKYGDENKSIDYLGDVSIGRIAIKNEQEIDNYIDKVIRYEFNPIIENTSYYGNMFVSRQDLDGTISGFSDSALSPFFNCFEKSNVVDFKESDRDYGHTSGRLAINTINNSSFGIHAFFGHGNAGGVAVGHSLDKRMTGIVARDNFEAWHYDEVGNGIDNLTNENFPAWCFSICCTTMPIDYTQTDGNPFQGEYTLGDAYTIGGKVGGIAFIGNTRVSYTSRGINISNFAFKNLYNNYRNSTDWTYTTAGSFIASIRNSTPNITHAGRLACNLLGDPLTPLYLGEPKVLTYSEFSDPNEEEGNICEFEWDGSEDLWIADQNMDNTFPTTATKVTTATDTHFTNRVNHLYTIFGKNTLPTILPLRLQRVSFFDYGLGDRYIFADKVIAGSSIDPSEASGNVQIHSSLNMTIESLSDVDLRTGVIVYDGATLNIIADGQVILDGIELQGNAVLYVKAKTIIKNSISAPSTAKITLIADNIIEPKAKARAKEAHKPMVVEGRTWWYESISQIDGPIDYGVTIGKEVDIDGVKWHEVRAVKSMLHGFDGVWHDCKDEDVVVGYVREEGTKVYSKPFIGHSFKPINELEFGHSNENGELLIYDFGTPSTHFNFGFQDDYNPELCGYNICIGYNISEISEIQNSGITYKKWTATYDGVDKGNDVCTVPMGNTFEYAEGIGITRAFCLSMLFYIPWEGSIDGDWDYRQPILRYVTEGENNTIIYENIGGEKLWNIPASVDNVVFDTSDAEVVWYNLQGIRVDKPTTPGVYVKVVGKTATKVVVK